MSAEIKFARDYGYPAASPFWFVYSDEAPGAGSFLEPAVSQAQAEQRAADLALSMAGVRFHVLAVMSTISTSPEVVGKRFDPTRVAPLPAVEPELDPEFAEVDEAPSPPTTLASFAADLPDDHPF